MKKKQLALMRGRKPMVQGLHDLSKWCAERGCTGKLVEIGSYAGESTSIFAQHFDAVYAVDPWEWVLQPRNFSAAQVYAKFNERTGKFQHVHPIKGRSVDVADQFDAESLDVVYIDGWHKYEAVKEDIAAWLPKVRPGGIISGHDYDEKAWPGVVKAVRENFPENRVVTFQDTSWAVQL
jgi:predicted O-methyltransferase YrrM